MDVYDLHLDFDALLLAGNDDEIARAVEQHPASATPHLHELITHHNELVRAAAVAAIADLGLNTCRPLLEQAVRDPSELVRADALTALFDLGHPLDAFFQSLAKLERDPDPDVRATALAMHYVAEADPALLDPLRDLLLDPHCHYHTQYIALNTFACYLILDRHPGVVDLLKAIRDRLDDSLDLARDIDDALSTAEGE